MDSESGKYFLEDAREVMDITFLFTLVGISYHGHTGLQNRLRNVGGHVSRKKEKKKCGRTISNLPY